MAEDLRAKGAEVRTVSADMTKSNGLDLIRAVTDDLEIGLLIYNAGVVGGPADFVKQDPEQYQGYIALNDALPATPIFRTITSGRMCDRCGRGGIIPGGIRRAASWARRGLPSSLRG